MRYGGTVILALVFSLPVFAADPFAGIWKPANFEKWKTSPDTPERFKSESIGFEPMAKDQYRYARIPSEGEPYAVVWNVDGKEHEIGETTQLSKFERILIRWGSNSIFPILSSSFQHANFHPSR